MSGGRSIRPLAALGLGFSLLVLAACAGEPGTTPTDMPPATAQPTSPAPTTSAPPVAEPAGEPACDTIISDTQVADFAEVGWSAMAEEFRAGSVSFPGGVYCKWGDYTVATADVQVYGWAPADPELTDAAIAELTASGWTREDEAEGIYLTEPQETIVLPDADGYGFTYLFGAGWVEVADTKQGLLLVEWPRA
jgi:hypothetical protein